MLIVDNNALSFAFNVSNGIPILPFYDNKADEELKHLTYYLNCLREIHVDDVRAHNDEAFGLMKMKYENMEEPQVQIKQRQSGQAIDDLNNPHTISREYLQCEPIEMFDDLPHNPSTEENQNQVTYPFV